MQLFNPTETIIGGIYKLESGELVFPFSKELIPIGTILMKLKYKSDHNIFIRLPDTYYIGPIYDTNVKFSYVDKLEIGG